MNLIEQVFCTACPVSIQPKKKHIKTESGQLAVLTGNNQYAIIPDTRNKYFSNGKMFDYFDSVDRFMESDLNAAIIPFYCLDRKQKGRRYFVSLLCRSSTTDVFNVEMANGNWIKNERDAKGWDKAAPAVGIEICEPMKAYLIYCIKEQHSDIGFRVKSVKEIKNPD